MYDTAFTGVTWDVRNWRLASTVLDQGHYQSRGSVANGYIGLNVAGAGPFFELDTPVNGDDINGWPLFSRRQTFAGLAGFWDQQERGNASTNFAWLDQYGGESFISGIPHWGGIILDVGNGAYLNASVDEKTISNYTTTYDYKAGVLSWKYTWSPKSHASKFNIQFDLFAHKLDINTAVVRLSVESSSDTNATIVNVLDGYSAVRTDFVDSGVKDEFIYSAVKPLGVNVTAYVFAALECSPANKLGPGKLTHDQAYLHTNDSSIAQSHTITLKARKRVHVTKYVSVASTDAFKDPKGQAHGAAKKARKQGFDGLLRSHVSEWAQVMPDHSVDDFTSENGTLPNEPSIIDDSIMAVVNPYYLLQNTVGDNAIEAAAGAPLNEHSISVGGLTSDSYAGMVFWDAETWMQPGLVAAFPSSAKRIVNYRVNHYAQAKKNAQTGYVGSQNQTFMSPDAALYSWTSGRAGNCTGTGPCFDYEYHLNGDIGLALINQWVATGDDKTFQDSYWPIYNSIATAFADLLKPNGSSWTLTNMTDPDEYANHIDAGGYTMPLISQTLQYANQFKKQFGGEANETWTDMANNVLVLRSNNITLEYTSMNNSVAVKQADVVLNTFPLDYTKNYSPQEALNDLDYFALKQSPDGPAMTYAIFSIVANAISPSGCSGYTYARYSYSSYARAPFYQLSEQLDDDATTNGGTHPAYPFLTGHGGANQVTLYGYLGLRLLPDDILHIDPNLPPQVPQIRYRTFYWRGWPITASANYTHTTISRAVNVKPLDTADQRFKNTTIAINVGQTGGSITKYSLPVNGSTVIIPNRKIGSIQTAAGNIAQCQPATSTDGFVPGQFPISVVDGAASTKWQPKFAANLSSVTVSLPAADQGKRITGCSLDWAQAPPDNFTMLFHNESTVSSSSAANSDLHFSVKISKPYNANSTSIDVIQLPQGNSTNITFTEYVAASKFATLFIQGNQALDAVDLAHRNGTGATVAEWSILTSN